MKIGNFFKIMPEQRLFEIFFLVEPVRSDPTEVRNCSLQMGAFDPVLFGTRNSQAVELFIVFQTIYLQFNQSCEM